MGCGSGTEHPVIWRAGGSPAHTGGMRYLLLALFAIGCGSEATNYDVRLGALDPPQCEGYLQLSGDSGTWRCEFIGGAAHLDLTTPGVVFLNLETTPGMLNQVRGEYVAGGGISGQMYLDGTAVTFLATPQ